MKMFPAFDILNEMDIPLLRSNHVKEETKAKILSRIGLDKLNDYLNLERRQMITHGFMVLIGNRNMSCIDFLDAIKIEKLQMQATPNNIAYVPNKYTKDTEKMT